MKRVLSFILIAAMTFLIPLSGCAGNGNGNTGEGSQGSVQTPSSGTTESAAPTEGSLTGIFPISKEKVEFSVFASSQAQDIPNNPMTKWYEEKTNVHINWELVPDQGAAQKLDMMLASGSYTDVIFGGFSKSQQTVYGGQGVFIKLDDLIEKYGVEFGKILEKYPQIKEMMTCADGNIYALPEVNDCYHCNYYYRMWIYQPWLDKLNLKMPESLEEYYEVLKAFKNGDPNDNGKKDEIPLCGNFQERSCQLWTIFTYPFIYSNNSSYTTLKDGKIVAAYAQPEWKEALQYLRKLYVEELLSPETFIQGGSQHVKMGENAEVPILGSSPGGHPAQFTKYNGGTGRFFEYKAVPALKGPTGQRYSYYDPYSLVSSESSGRFVITNKCKIPEIAFRWADGLYDAEASLRSTIGVKGEDWDWAKEGQVGINGKPAIWVSYDYNKAKEKSWDQMGLNYRSDDLRLGQVSGGEKDIEVILYNETKNKYEPYKPADSMLIPPLTYNEQNSAEYAELHSVISDYIEASWVRFITGDLDLEKDWDAYLNELKNMNIDRYLEIMQKQYDIQKGK